jgi:hypothetical protein
MTSNVLAKSTSTKRAAGAVSAARRGAAAAQSGGGLDVVDATALLGDIGYLLVHGAPFDRGPAYLLVAIRPQPTRAHFDPEHIEYWSAGPATAEPVALEWPISAPSTDYSWGSIKIVDRIGATNAFVSFGGTLSVSRGGGLSAALFSSEAPILAMGGRGEGGDPLAASVAGFFARLRAGCGADPDLARRATVAGPIAIYAAYLARTMAIHKSQLNEITVSPRLHAVLRYERCRLLRDCAPAATAGEALARELQPNPS